MGPESTWSFIIDECLDPMIAERLRANGLDAWHVQEVDALGKGADDETEILPSLRQRDAILVSGNVQDFAAMDFEDHEGILLVFDGRRSAVEYVAAIRRLVDRDPDRDALRHREPLDDWL